MGLADLMTGTWVFLGLVTVWRVAVVWRDPDPSPGRIAVAALFGTAFLSNTFNRPAVASYLDTWRPGLGQLLGYIALIFFFAGFVYFFAAGIGARENGGGPLRAALTSWRVQLAAPVVFSALLTASWLLTPRAEGFPTFGNLATESSVWPYVSYLILQVYMFYGTIGSTVLAWKAGTNRPRVWQWTFRTCSVGMGMCTIGGPTMRTPVLISVLVSGQTLGPTFTSIAAAVNFAGIVTLLIGLSLVGARTWLDRSVEQLTAKRQLMELRPLWDLLYDTYPEIALYPRRSYPTELLTVSPSAGYLFRRRAVECRDGLWRLSPYVADPEGDESALTYDEQARLVLDAAARVRLGDGGPVASAVAIAAPPDADQRPAADDEALISLARAIRRQRNTHPAPRAACGVELSAEAEPAALTRAAVRPTAPE